MENLKNSEELYNNKSMYLNWRKKWHVKERLVDSSFSYYSISLNEIEKNVTSDLWITSLSILHSKSAFHWRTLCSIVFFFKRLFFPHDNVKRFILTAHLLTAKSRQDFRGTETIRRGFPTFNGSWVRPALWDLDRVLTKRKCTQSDNLLQYLNFKLAVSQVTLRAHVAECDVRFC